MGDKITAEQIERIRSRAMAILDKAGIIIAREERSAMEITDLGLGDIENVGLQAIVYVNNSRYCAKELIMLPNQICPEHRHPFIDEKNPGKQETFRCRWGEAFLYVPGEKTALPKAVVPEIYRIHLSVHHEIRLMPGDQYTLRPGERHWFQAGSEGAVISEFSSASLDEEDIFTDPRVRRVPVLDK